MRLVFPRCFPRQIANRIQKRVKDKMSVFQSLRAFSDRNESVGIPKTARVRFKLDAGEGGQHA